MRTSRPRVYEQLTLNQHIPIQINWRCLTAVQYIRTHWSSASCSYLVVLLLQR